MKSKKIIAMISTLALATSLIGCTSSAESVGSTASNTAASSAAASAAASSATAALKSSVTMADTTSSATTQSQTPNQSQMPNQTFNSSSSNTNIYSSTPATIFSDSSALDTSSLFSNRDLEQTADLNGATYKTVVSGSDYTITSAGVYVLSGSATESTVIIDAADDAKVEIVLNGLSITNTDAPAIYVKNADKVFVTTTETTNSLKVTGTFVADGDTNVDAVIFSKDDLVLKGLGELKITSSDNAVVSKDDLKITGGTYVVNADHHGFEANDSIVIYDGNFDVTVSEDAFHSENDEDFTLGYLYIKDGTFEISAGDDSMRGNSIVQIDGGNINITTSTEGIEGTYIQLNGGNIKVYATDDGINATKKSDYSVVIQVNGGTIDVTVGSGDTDGFDANGNIIINGGTISVQANSAFDADSTATINGGTVTVNGQLITTITQQQMGPGGGKGGSFGVQTDAPTGGPTGLKRH